ncbi:MAG: hypothetical protein N3D11_03295 [Candidatus Sumerlaeia bacterium]|nr:hypothetical protein [Candidatus Sumerlaeia bacterium]
MSPTAMNLLHPIFHLHGYHIGSRIDIERILPSNLEDEDCDLLIDDLSEPPHFIERLAPVSTQFGKETVRGKNWTELMIKSLRALERLLAQITLSIHQLVQSKLGERGMVPFMSADFDADTLHRIIEMDYEIGENIYGRILELFRSGVLAPTLTVPFQIILPLVEREDDVRLLIRMGLNFYWPLMMRYQRYVAKVHGEDLFVGTFWLPEAGYSTRVLTLLHEEFMAKCKEEKIAQAHLLLLLDHDQCVQHNGDALMKSWNAIPLDDKGRTLVSVVLRDRTFSEWVMYSNPSVKKLLDRTIAKADSDLNSKGIEYCWSHFDELPALCYNPKTALNFEQKVIKLTELGYLPISPDVFVRRKLLERYGRAPNEPVHVRILERTARRDWHPANPNMGRWEGFLDGNVETRIVDENHPYFRRTPSGRKEEPGPQCWKIAFCRAIRTCFDTVRGDYDKAGPGMLRVLAEMVPTGDRKIRRQNVERFLLAYSYVYWREHFLNFDLSEGDLNLHVLAPENLLYGLRGAELTDEQIIIAAVAAQAYYFALSSLESFATLWENMDQRAAYQCVVMACLAMINAIHVHHWMGRPEMAQKIVAVYREELIGFESAYTRYNLASFGVKPEEWKQAIKSEVPDCQLNMVERAARRLAARHLRDLGYKREFPKTDESLSTNVGHIWSAEVEHGNFIWENPLFYGTPES